MATKKKKEQRKCACGAVLKVPRARQCTACAVKAEAARKEENKKKIAESWKARANKIGEREKQNHAVLLKAATLTYTQLWNACVEKEAIDKEKRALKRRGMWAT